jgi:hypothetical protein
MDGPMTLELSGVVPLATVDDDAAADVRSSTAL